MNPRASDIPIRWPTFAVILAIVLAAACCIAASLHRARQLRLAGIDQEELAQVESLARQIQELRGGPTRATEDQWTNAALNAICERAAGAAGLPKRALAEVVPFPPRRIGRTDYQEVATRVSLEGVDAEQLATFAFAVQQDSAAMIAKELELSVSRSDAAKWDASITFAGLVYSPTKDRREG